MAAETIAEDEIWADIDAIFLYPPREPGDIDCEQIRARYGVNETNGREKMKRLVDSGEWEYITVSDDTCMNGRRKVIRKVKR